MKIVFLSTNSDESGAPRHCETLINGLIDDHTIHFVSGDRGAVYQRLEKYISCHFIDGFTSKFSPMRDLYVIFRVMALFRELKPDLVHIHSSKAGLVGRVACILFRIPFVYTIHGFGWRGMGKIASGIILASERMLSFSSIGRYVLVSHDLENDAVNKVGIFRERITVLHNSIDDVPGSLIREHTDDSVLRLFMPARVCSAKDHKTLFEALLNVPFRFKLLLAGGGTDSPEFYKFASDILGDKVHCVEFLGEVGNVAEILSKTDIFLLISNFEAFPVSIIEAFRAGLPVVATDVGGVAEAVDSKVGYLVKVRDIGAIRTALTDVSVYEKRVSLGSAARSRYIEKFGVARMLSRLKDIYTSSLS